MCQRNGLPGLMVFESKWWASFKILPPLGLEVLETWHTVWHIYANDFIGIGPSGTVRTKAQVMMPKLRLHPGFHESFQNFVDFLCQRH